MQAFIPPSIIYPLAWAIDFTIPSLLKIVQNIDEVVISEKDKEMLRSLREDRMLFASNHPTTAEPPISFYLSNIMGARFHYMAARQVFDWDHGMVGKLISSLGAFSVLAGTSDRESLKQSRKILSEPKGKLVLFPEGEPTSGENDSLMPLQPGVAQLGFWGYEDAKKLDPNADITVLPAFMKYVINAKEDEVRSHLDKSAKNLENKLGINPGNKNILRRFLTIGRTTLEQAEKEYKVESPKDSVWDFRIGRVRHAILDGVADKFSIQNYDRKADAIMKLRQLLATLEMILVGFPDPKLPKMSAEDLEWARRECLKAFDLIVIKPEYLMGYPSPERFYEWLIRLEAYVFNKTPRMLGGEKPHLSRKAYVYFAKPFHLSEYYEAYKKDKKKTVEDVTVRLRIDIQRLLDNCMLELSKPLVKPNDIGDDVHGF